MCDHVYGMKVIKNFILLQFSRSPQAWQKMGQFSIESSASHVTSERCEKVRCTLERYCR